SFQGPVVTTDSRVHKLQLPRAERPTAPVDQNEDEMYLSWCWKGSALVNRAVNFSHFDSLWLAKFLPARDKGDILRFLIESKSAYNKERRQESYEKFLSKRVSQWASLPEQDVLDSCDTFAREAASAKLDVAFQTFKRQLI